MVTSTISIPELIWTIACLLGLIFNGRQFYRAAGDYVVVKVRRINSIREYAAITTLVTFGSWTFVQFMFVLFGAIAMTKTNPDHLHQPAFLQYVLVTGFVSISVFLAFTGYIVDTRRKHIIEMIAQLEE